MKRQQLTQMLITPISMKHLGNDSGAGSMTLSLHFNGHYPGEPGLAGVY